MANQIGSMSQKKGIGTHMQDFLANVWVQLALAILLLVGGWKLNATGANWLLVAAAGILAACIFRSAPLATTPLLPKIVWTACLGSGAFLLIYYTLWTTSAGGKGGVVLNTIDQSGGQTKTPAPASPTPEKMPTLHDLYTNDFPSAFGFCRDEQFESITDDSKKAMANVKANLDIKSNTKFLSVYIPDSSLTYDVCLYVAHHYDELMAKEIGGIKLEAFDPADSVRERSDDLISTRRAYIYYEGWLTLEQLGTLEGIYRKNNLTVYFRDRNYATRRWLQKRGTGTSAKQP